MPTADERLAHFVITARFCQLRGRPVTARSIMHARQRPAAQRTGQKYSLLGLHACYSMMQDKEPLPHAKFQFISPLLALPITPFSNFFDADFSLLCTMPYRRNIDVPQDGKIMPASRASGRRKAGRHLAFSSLDALQRDWARLPRSARRAIFVRQPSPAPSRADGRDVRSPTGGQEDAALPRRRHGGIQDFR